MPVYDYKCTTHGLFYELNTMENSSKPCACPTCGALSARVIMIAPEFLSMKKENRDAHARNEKAMHEPIFSTPEYIFSIPGRLKNLLEWCVSTTVFSEKPVAVITASASGEKGHEELLLILKTLGAMADDKHQVLIKGIKGKFDGNGLLESNTFVKVSKLVTDFISSVS